MAVLKASNPDARTRAHTHPQQTPNTLVVGHDVAGDAGFRFVLWLRSEGYEASLGTESVVNGTPASESIAARATIDRLWRTYAVLFGGECLFRDEPVHFC